MSDYFNDWNKPKFSVNNSNLQEFKSIDKISINTIDYDKKPIKIKVKDYDYARFYAFFGSLVVLCFFLVVFCFKFNPNKINLSIMLSALIVSSIVGAYKEFINASKNQNSYIYFKNTSIIQKNNKEIIKQFKICDIKLLLKSFKHFDTFTTKNLTPMQRLFLPVTIIVVIAYIILFMMLTDALAILILVIFFLGFLIFGFRLADGVNLDILRNNVLIKTNNDRIILLNLTKEEIKKLEKYFKKFNIKII